MAAETKAGWDERFRVDGTKTFTFGFFDPKVYVDRLLGFEPLADRIRDVAKRLRNQQLIEESNRVKERRADAAKAPAVEDQDGETDKPDEVLVQKLRGNGRELLVLLWGCGNVKRDKLWRKIWAKRKSTSKGKQISDEQKTKTIDRAVVYLNRRLEELGYRSYEVKHNGGLYSLKRPQE